MKTMRILSEVKLPFDVEVLEPMGNAREVILLLHGYAESGARILRLLKDALPENALIVAPNGPFPMPRRTENSYKVGYAWYFYDPTKEDYFVDPGVALSCLGALFREKPYDGLPLRIIGFSQGGYFAPLVSEGLPQTRQIIGIACEFLRDDMKVTPAFRMDQIHGDKDEVVTLERARKANEKLMSSGGQGEFCVLPNTAHLITDEVRAEVARLLSRVPRC